MKNPNQTTIDAYNQQVQAYIDKTPRAHQESHKPMLRWIDAALNAIPSNGRILEVGSATPRDANYIRSKGYEVQCSDAPEEFVIRLKQQGEDAIQLNILTDEIQGHYDMIFANAVAPHFTVDDVNLFLDKIHTHLPKDGLLVFNVKQGDSEEWVNEKFDSKRYIHYWMPKDIKEVTVAHGFKILFIETDVVGDLPNHRWTNIVAQKI